MTPLSRSNAALHRDAALVRIGRARRWLIAGAAGLTGALAAFVSATAHGHTLKKGAVVRAPTRTTGSSSTSTPAQMPPLASPSSLGLQGPVQDPQSSSGGSSQSSGGSSQSSGGSSQSQSSPAPQSQAAPAPAPSPSPSSSGAVVSGGS